MEDKQTKYDKAYLKMALEWGELSYCKRRKVGALIVKDNMIISDGYNGKMMRVIQNGMYFMLRQMLLQRFLHQLNLQKELLSISHFLHAGNAVN